MRQAQRPARSFGVVAAPNGPVERVFNSLNQTDVPSRQPIGKETLHDTLFLHGNWRAVEQLLLQRLADSCNAEGPRRRAPASWQRVSGCTEPPMRRCAVCAPEPPLRIWWGPGAGPSPEDPFADVSLRRRLRRGIAATAGQLEALAGAVRRQRSRVAVKAGATGGWAAPVGVIRRPG